jgi:Lon protease-like protein
VETVGVYRFKILESGTLDGYNVGRVERIEDIEEEEELELERLALARSAVRHQEERQRAKAAHEKEVLENEKAQPRARMPGSIPPPSIATPAHTSQAHSAIPGAPTLSDPTNPTADDSVELTNAQLLEVCKGFVEALRTGSTPWLLQRLSSSLPPMPEDAREFTWWMAMLMPVDDHEKAKLLQVSTNSVSFSLEWLLTFTSSDHELSPTPAIAGLLDSADAGIVVVQSRVHNLLDRAIR